MRCAGTVLASAIATAGAALVIFGAGGAAAAVTPRDRALLLLDSGEASRAAALLDSLLRVDPSDASAAYWAARATEDAGNEEAARCRYLRLESVRPGTREALLSQWRRRALERRAADALAARGPDRVEPKNGSNAGGAVLLLPPENPNAPEDAPLFGLAWNYLLHDALRGSGICAVPVPVALAAADLLRYGRAIRAPLPVSTAPVNSVEGLRARLSILPAPDGSPYLDNPAGGWGSDVEAALVRFQKDRGLAPTGEADPATQARLEVELRTWLEQIPPPVEPKAVSRVAELCGATAVVRGTWRRDEGRITVALAPLDAEGMPRFGDPVTVSFTEGNEPSAAREAASGLAFRFGGEVAVGAPAWSLTPPELEQAAATLLLVDRGLPRAALETWAHAPLSWFSWPALASTRDAVGLVPEQATRLEQEVRDAWLAVPGLDYETAFDGLMEGLGLPSGPADGAWGAPEPWRVLGSEGILHIHGERE